MKAAQISNYGGPEVMRINDVDKPTPTEGQVLVEVYAAAVNPFDVKVREGLVRDMAEPPFPATLGGDVTGTVAEVGAGVIGFKPGQAVYGQANALGGQGSFAEFTTVKASQLAAKPNSLDFTQSAASPLVGCSAYQALVDHINLQPGQKILIDGGAGGIGSIAIQLAKHLGAQVAATVSSDQLNFVKNLGADEVIDYQNQDFSKLLKDYDAVYDTVGGDTNRKSYKVLKPGGILVSMVAQADDELVKKYGVRYVSQFTRTTTERLTKLAELIDAGAIKVQIDKVFPLEEAAQALEYQKTGRPRGKVIIQVKK